VTATPHGDDPDKFDYQNPRLDCDIIMKGGVTSGVVYPHAVCEIAKTYRLRNVGGTSAGAIAAALAGAAEAGRATGGFTKLAKLPDWIGSDNNLYRLFRPQRRTRRIFRIFMAALGGGLTSFVRVSLAAVASYPLTTIAAATPGAALIYIATRADDSLVKVAGIVGGSLLLLLMVPVALVARLLFALGHAVPRNGYGLCSGQEGGTAKEPTLTPWLADRLNEYANKPLGTQPLTFGELQAARVNLEFVTTNLTLRRPYRIPWETREYFFDPNEFDRLFPNDVVRWLEDHPPPGPENANEQREWQLRCRLLRPLRPLPSPADLPVIVGARMSLSFPFLLSTVPLWSVDMSLPSNQQASDEWKEWVHEHQVRWNELVDGGDSDLPKLRLTAERCLFSDGGISSNFPIHFFDSPLPTRPTFAINLRGFHAAHPQSTDEQRNTYLPARSGGGLLEWWYRFPEHGGLKKLKAFIEAIARTMQNRVDEAQMRVPGYRDRIAHVSLSSTEGGMNLKMERQVLDRLTRRGMFAGRRLVNRFAEPPPTEKSLSWDSHRWTRYRSALTALSRFVESFADAYALPDEGGNRSYAQLSQREDSDPPSAYRWGEIARRKLGEDFTAALDTAASVVKEKPVKLDKGGPRPEPEARIVPRT
jgi:predicted acylesterase/phospholipase RssA